MYKDKQERRAHRKELEKFDKELAKNVAIKMVNAITNNAEILDMEHKVTLNGMNYFAVNTRVESKVMSRYHNIAFDCPLSSLKFHDSNVSDLNKGATIEECIRKYKLYINRTFEQINP